MKIHLFGKHRIRLVEELVVAPCHWVLPRAAAYQVRQGIAPVVERHDEVHMFEVTTNVLEDVATSNCFTLISTVTELRAEFYAS